MLMISVTKKNPELNNCLHCATTLFMILKKKETGVFQQMQEVLQSHVCVSCCTIINEVIGQQSLRVLCCHLDVYVLLRSAGRCSSDCISMCCFLLWTALQREVRQLSKSNLKKFKGEVTSCHPLMQNDILSLVTILACFVLQV